MLHVCLSGLPYRYMRDAGTAAAAALASGSAAPVDAACVALSLQATARADTEFSPRKGASRELVGAVCATAALMGGGGGGGAGGTLPVVLYSVIDDRADALHLH